LLVRVNVFDDFIVAEQLSTFEKCVIWILLYLLLDTCSTPGLAAILIGLLTSIENAVHPLELLSSCVGV
jgi:hypothetical protein